MLVILCDKGVKLQACNINNPIAYSLKVRQIFVTKNTSLN